MNSKTNKVEAWVVLIQVTQQGLSRYPEHRLSGWINRHCSPPSCLSITALSGGKRGMSSIPRNKPPKGSMSQFFGGFFVFLNDLYLSKYEYIHYVHIYKYISSLLALLAVFETARARWPGTTKFCSGPSLFANA